MSMSMLRCRDIVDLLHDYLDGALEPPARDALEAHLAGCQDCSAFMKTYRGTVRATRRLEPSRLPPELRERLLSFLLRSRPND